MQDVSLTEGKIQRLKFEDEFYKRRRECNTLDTFIMIFIILGMQLMEAKKKRIKEIIKRIKRIIKKIKD